MPFEQIKSDTNRGGFCFDTLLALAKHGPCWDGDVPSKSGRDALIEHGLAVRVVFNGQDGYTGLTYKGRDFFCEHMGVATLKEALAKQSERSDTARRESAPVVEYHHV